MEQDAALKEALKILDKKFSCEPAHGFRAEMILLKNRSIDDLNSRNLRALAKAYNWQAKHANAFLAEKKAYILDPIEPGGTHQLIISLSNWCFSEHRNIYLEIDRMIEEKIGSEVEWRLAKAHEYILGAITYEGYEDYEIEYWVSEDGYSNPEYLPLAGEEIEKVLNIDPSVKEKDEKWNVWLAPLIHNKKYSHLRR